jgi:hypothetical protein
MNSKESNSLVPEELRKISMFMNSRMSCILDGFLYSSSRTYSILKGKTRLQLILI